MPLLPADDCSSCLEAELDLCTREQSGLLKRCLTMLSVRRLRHVVRCMVSGAGNNPSHLIDFHKASSMCCAASGPPTSRPSSLVHCCLITAPTTCFPKHMLHTAASTCGTSWDRPGRNGRCQLGNARRSGCLPLGSCIQFFNHHCIHSSKLCLTEIQPIAEMQVPSACCWSEAVPTNWQLYITIQHITAIIHQSHVPNLNPKDHHFLRCRCR